MLSEISQTRKRTNSVGFHLHPAPEIVRVLETENRVGGSETWGVAGAGRGGQCLGTEFQFGMKKNSQRGTVLSVSQCEPF